MAMTTTANNNKLFKENSFRVVGTLKDVNLESGNRRDNGQEYISGTITVVSSIGGKANEFEISLYANKLTKQGKESQLFTSYSKLNELIGKKVDINGELRENRYWSKNTNQMVSAQLLSGRFVSGVAESTQDMATYVLGGFIVKTPVEKVNKNGEVYRYDVTVGQSNFAGDSMSMYTLHVDPSDRNIIAGVESYNIGDTVRLKGDLVFTVDKVTVEDKNNAFGEAVTRTYTNRQRNYFIKGGSNPIDDDSAYDNTQIKTLIEAYKARDVELADKAADSNADMPTTSAAPVTKRQTSLI